MTLPWFQAIDSNGKDIAPELLSFAGTIGIETIIPGRYSALLLLRLFEGSRSGLLNPARVVRQIKALEANGSGMGLKTASPFKHPPLQGLWHQHYLEDGLACIAHNIRRGIGKFGLPWLEQQVAEAKAIGNEKYLTEADFLRIADDVVMSNWERLVENAALTGEWIIYAKHKDKNYYLCLGKHNSGDDVLRAQIDAFCLREFPFLKEILIT